MKKSFAILLVGFFIGGLIDFSIAQNLTNQQKVKIEQEIDSVFSVMVKAAENLDAEKLRQGVDDRYQAGFITNGVYFAQFDSLMKNFKNKSQGIIRQNISFQKKKITVLSATMALLTACGDTKVDIESGNSFSVKFFWSFVYARINNDWKVIQSHQSSTRN